jgi:arylsulfatase A-like enzyme
MRSRIWLGAILLSALGPAIPAWAAPARPNVLILALDTLRGDHLHCAGREWLATPHLDALARDGIRCERCIATTSWTLPSFATILTGLLPYDHGAVGGEHEVLAAEHSTLAELLAAAGYATGGFVAVHFLNESYGMTQGLQEFEQALPEEDLYEQARRVTSQGLAFAEAHRDEPFYLFMHYYDIHSPYRQPVPFDHLYYVGDERKPGVPILEGLLSADNRAVGNRRQYYAWLEGITDLAYPIRAYAAGVTFVDAFIGVVLDRLRELGLYDDLLIVLVSDHGEHLGEHDTWFTHHYLYQEVLRVPLIVKLPGRRRAGTVMGTPVSTLDILPTVLRAVDLPVPPECSGLPLQEQLESSPRGTRYLPAEWGAAPEDYAKALVEWPWKLLLFARDGVERYELYRLDTDPCELTSLVPERPEMLGRLRARLRQLFPPEHPVLADPRARPAELDPASRERLRALGYVD